MLPAAGADAGAAKPGDPPPPGISSRLPDQFSQSGPDVIQSVEQLRIHVFQVSECQRNIETSSGLSRRTESIAIPLPSSPSVAPATLGNIERNARSSPSKLPREVSVPYLNLRCKSPKSADDIEYRSVDSKHGLNSLSPSARAQPRRRRAEGPSRMRSGARAAEHRCQRHRRRPEHGVKLRKP